MGSTVSKDDRLFTSVALINLCVEESNHRAAEKFRASNEPAVKSDQVIDKKDKEGVLDWVIR